MSSIFCACQLGEEDSVGRCFVCCRYTVFKGKSYKFCYNFLGTSVIIRDNVVMWKLYSKLLRCGTKIYGVRLPWEQAGDGCTRTVHGIDQNLWFCFVSWTKWDVPKFNRIFDCVFNSWVAPEALLRTKKLVFDDRIFFNSESSFVVLVSKETTRWSPVVFVAGHLAR